LVNRLSMLLHVCPSRKETVKCHVLCLGRARHSRNSHSVPDIAQAKRITELAANYNRRRSLITEYPFNTKGNPDSD
jgi:hypothetical protein